MSVFQVIDVHVVYYLVNCKEKVEITIHEDVTHIFGSNDGLDSSLKVSTENRTILLTPFFNKCHRITVEGRCRAYKRPSVGYKWNVILNSIYRK